MLHTFITKTDKKKRVGRGGARGKNAGHGNKGQKSRAGHRIRPAVRDEIQRLPKLRGHNKNRARGVRQGKVVRTVTLTMLGKNFGNGATVSPLTLVSMNLISNTRGKTPKVKIVATGEIGHALKVVRCEATPGAKTKIEAAGGSVA